MSSRKSWNLSRSSTVGFLTSLTVEIFRLITEHSSSFIIYFCFVERHVENEKHSSDVQWCGPRPSVLGQDRSETKKKSVLVLVFHAAVLVLVLYTTVSVLVLQVWCCVVKHDLVTLVVIMILKDVATFYFVVSLFCA